MDPLKAQDEIDYKAYKDRVAGEAMQAAAEAADGAVLVELNNHLQHLSGLYPLHDVDSAIEQYRADIRQIADEAERMAKYERLKKIETDLENAKQRTGKTSLELIAVSTRKVEDVVTKIRADQAVRAIADEQARVEAEAKTEKLGPVVKK